MKRILVVDDDAAVRSGIIKLLRRENYSPLEAANGRAGVELARKELPDLVLCDLSMPEVDGYEVLRSLRAQPATSAIPVILMTGEGGQAGARSGMERGADDYLLKPFRAAALLAAIEARLERNRAQRSVQARAEATEVRFFEILSSLGEGVIWADEEQRVTFANRAAEEIVGLNPGGMVGRRFQEFLTEPSKADIQRNVELRKAGRKSTYELEVVTPEGSHRQVAVTGTPKIGADGTFCGSFVVLRNISEQKRTELALQRERILLRTLIDHLPCSIYAKDRSGRKTLANPADVRSIGLQSEADVLGKTDLDLFPWEIASRFLADDLQVIQAGRAVLDREELVENHRGERRWFLTSKVPLQDEKGQIIGLLGMGTDVTERRQAEQHLRQLSHAVEQSPASVVITDTAGRIEYVNRKFTELTGYAPDEVLGRNPRLLKSGATPPEVYRDLWQTIGAGKDWHGELRNRKRDGGLFWAAIAISPVKDGVGSITGFLAISRDVTDEKRAEQERSLMEIQLRQAQKLEAIGQLAAGIAHEINTPTQYVGDNTRFLQESFGSILGLLQAYQELLRAAQAGPVPPEMTRRARAGLEASDLEYLLAQIPAAIKESLEGLDRVTKIVCAMKEFSHPGGKDKCPADLNQAIETTATVARNEWKYVADMKLDLAPDLPPVPCFLDEFNQCILNLVINAAHAIGDVVKAHPGTKGLISVSTRRLAEQVEVRVADTGTGIPEEVRPHIFEPFFTTKGVGKGTGQGLSIVYGSIVKKHGGAVSFESQVGHGTTFIVRLPISPPAAPADPRRTSEAAGPSLPANPSPSSVGLAVPGAPLPGSPVAS